IVFKTIIENNIASRNDVSTIKVNGVSVQSPYTIDVVQNANPQITVEALPIIEYDNIVYYFNHWEQSSVNVSSSLQFTFRGNNDETICAKYIGYPDKPFGLHMVSTGPGVSQGIGIAWNEYPNANVSKYQIYRNTSEKKGSGGENVFLAEVPRGTTYYTDNGLNYDPNGNWNVSYRVLPYYAPDYKYAHEDFLIHYVYSSGSPGGVLDKNNFAEKKELEYKLGNYPNPFNPATKILFGIKKDDFVSIQVFDILGNKICDLVKDYMEAGNHEVLFDGSVLPSGFYIYTIRAGNYVETKKMMLLK
ncbi:MAG: T9SS type A sorting domain-containing protein, partial [Syntrophothermus sp.]